MSGRWPRLVRPELCTDEAVVTLTDGENGDGSPAVAEVLTLRCRLTCRPAESITPNRDYGDGSRRGIEAERVAVRGGGTALFDGDIAPGRTVLAGTVAAGSRVWRIVRSCRGRDPDGTVNYTKLELG